MILLQNALHRPTVRLLAIASVMAVFVPTAQAQQSSGNNMHWLRQQIEVLPEIHAAQQKRDASLSQADSYSRALYNPELGTGYEREGEQDNYQVSISQKIDWWDQKGSREQQAQFLRIQAEQDYRFNYQTILKNALLAFVNWQAAKQRYELALDQEQQLDQLIKLVKSRSANGDLGQIDVELTLLSLSQTLADTAQAVAAYHSAENRVRQWMPNWQPTTPVLNAAFWSNTQQFLTTDTSNPQQSDKELLQALPELRIAKAEWKIQQAQAETVRRGNKAEPTIGITAGQNGNTDVVGLNLSIPLNIRNNYSAETRSAERMALETEARFRAQYRKLRFDLKGAFGAWQSYNLQFTQWQSLVKGRIESSGDLLEKQWRSGDLSTTNYLIALNQRAESLLSGIELEKQTRIALKNLMLQSGRLIDLPPVQHDFSIE